jgi:hypothetical protein
MRPQAEEENEEEFCKQKSEQMNINHFILFQRQSARSR